ncbi:nuclear transport factor 2 family protein [Streptomyces sp. ITFR-6]|uniref:nuclear transport factor 2 family protein n=1 Tax=Streptomyces sp. ITFR-6 TaxID=3075197 RepID=UPI0037D9FE95
MPIAAPTGAGCEPEDPAWQLPRPRPHPLDWPEGEPGRAATPWMRHRSTRADAAAHYRELGGHHVPGAAATEIERVLVDGDDAVVFGEIRQTARSTGRAYRARFALHLTFAGGLVTRHHVYEDSLAVARAFDAEEPGAKADRQE